MQEIRFDKRLPVREVKEQLAYRFGSPVENQKLELKDQQGVQVCEMANDHEDLQFYGAQSGFTIHVVDTNPSAVLAGLEDLSAVQKYEMSDADYDNREQTFRKFKAQMIAQNPNFLSAHSV